VAVDDGVHVFRDDDDGYLAWLAANPHGYVTNILGSYSLAAARTHRSVCHTINGRPPRGGKWTAPYEKWCAERLDDLDRKAVVLCGDPATRCGTCRPTTAAVQPISLAPTKKGGGATLPAGRCEIHGPALDSTVVQAWADDYIRFERRPPWQEQLRNEIRSGCSQLEPSPEQVLHATFFGAKHPKADVENLVLYNIDSFKVPGRNGIRFEHGGTVPPAPDDAEYQFGYSYALAPRSGSFTHWRQGRRLASFDWTDLGASTRDTRLANVWLAVWRAKAQLFFPLIGPDTPFGVRVQVRPPYRCQPVWGGLVKGIFDGVICAFQAHTDTTVLPEVVPRLAKTLPAEPVEIEGYLRSRHRAVLGEVRRLVAPYQAGVKWDPSDHLCLVGDLLAVEPKPKDDHWAITGEIFELARR